MPFALCIKVNLVHAHIECAGYIHSKVIANIDAVLSSAVCFFHCKIKNTRLRLFNAGLFRSCNRFEVQVQFGNAKFLLLNFLETVGDQVERVFLRKVFKGFDSTRKEKCLFGVYRYIIF